MGGGGAWFLRGGEGGESRSGLWAILREADSNSKNVAVEGGGAGGASGVNGGSGIVIIRYPIAS